MSPYPAWLLPLLLFGVWSLWIFAAVAQVAAENVRRGAAGIQRSGVSIMPGMPFCPLFFWGIVWLADRLFFPWGTVTIGALHLIFAAFMLTTLFRDVRYCRLRLFLPLSPLK